jgi:hypothetical protein
VLQCLLALGQVGGGLADQALPVDLVLEGGELLLLVAQSLFAVAGLLLPCGEPASSRPKLAARELALSSRACTRAFLSLASPSICRALGRRLAALALAWSRRCYAARLASLLARAGLGGPTVEGSSGAL